MITGLGYFLVFFGGCMSWTLAIGQLMDRNRKFFNNMFAMFLFSVGACQLYSWLVITGLITRYHDLGFLHLPFLCLAGPSFYLCFKSVLWHNFKLRKRDVLHPVPVIIVIILIIPLVTADESVKIEVLSNPPSFRSGNFMRTYYSFVLSKILFDGLVYLASFIKECSFLASPVYIRKNNVPPLLLIVIGLLSTSGLLYCISVVINNFVSDVGSFYHTIIEVLSIFLLFTVLIIYYMSTRHENYFAVLRQQQDKNRYEKSRIKNLNISAILPRLKQLMEDEKVFTDENLTLNSLSGMLGIEPYQLSQIINEQFKKNFNSYVNSYRINEAVRMLKDHIDFTVTHIAYSVGFNSTAPFYDWFHKLTGTSPTKFRRKNKINF